MRDSLCVTRKGVPPRAPLHHYGGLPTTKGRPRRDALTGHDSRITHHSSLLHIRFDVMPLDKV